jgi:branched-chain amino acid transport system substrate-binding protein
VKKVALILAVAVLAMGLVAQPALTAAKKPIKIAVIIGLTGPLEVYAKQMLTGFKMGMEYATRGKMKVLGRPIQLIIKDTQLKPAVGKRLLAEAYKDDKVVLAVGPVSSGVALAMLPVAAEYKKILLVEPAVADSITGSRWNRYIFRTGRNSSQDAVSNAVAIAGKNVVIATLAQDYAFGRDGVAAYKQAAQSRGAKIVHEEYVPIQTTDFTAPALRIIKALAKYKNKKKFVFVIWAGRGNPLGKLHAMQLQKKYGIRITTGGNILAALKFYKPLKGMEGATYYYYDIPKNRMNKWLVREHMKRFKVPPDFFTCGGMAAAMAVVTALRKAKSTDTEKLIKAMEGMKFKTPKGPMIFRKADHQALQRMYHFKIVVDPKLPWAVCKLVRVLRIRDMKIPIRVRR